MDFKLKNEDICEVEFVDEEKVKAVKKLLPSEKDIFALAETFKALADPTRVKIIFSLSKKELCVHDLASLLGMSLSAISHQLRILRNMKLVKFRKQGKMVYYCLDDEHIENLFNQGLEHVQE
ncbi:transcriptional regulator [Candidatus Aerophobetes bacterium]|uniref:Transcriptional regulator n=1 Tax=Aerophobetes bacterium TaxID=2030807 RepID=A0A662DGP4_UNCAE|nr:MAG: transcriptional regulator [Candidatus Aerophobetes bacterium]